MFGVSYIEIRLKYEKNILLSSSRAFSLSTLLFLCLALWKTVRLHGKKLQNATNNFRIGAYISDAGNWQYVLSAYAKLCATAKFSKNIVEEIWDLTANDIRQILWGHWVEIGDFFHCCKIVGFLSIFLHNLFCCQDQNLLQIELIALSIITRK